jgi:FecR protein
MNYALATTLAVANTLFATAVFAAPAGTLLFAQPGSEIVGNNGLARPAKRGAILEEGERLRTPVGAISQLLLPDGSLVGMRPGSELKLDFPTNASDKAKQMISLLQGSARVIGSELMDATKPSGFTLQSGLATLRLQGADLESAVVKPDASKTSGAPDAGSYNRMLIGIGSIGSGTMLEPLAPRQVSFVGAINVAPVVVASISPTLFSPLVTPVANASLSTTLTKSTLVTPLSTSSLSTLSGAPAISTSVVTTTSVIKPPTITTALVLAPPPVTIVQPIYVAPIYIAPIYVAPVTRVKTCTFTTSGLKVCF